MASQQTTTGVAVPESRKLGKGVPGRAVGVARLALRAVRIATRSRTIWASGPESYFLPSGYREWRRPTYFSDFDSDKEVVYQPDVYAAVGAIAEVLESRTVVDLGCGKASKLVGIDSALKTIGVDYGSNLEYCRKMYPERLWLEADLEGSAAVPLSPNEYLGGVVVCSDVIEHLVHPESLLGQIHTLLESASVAVLSTPDRRLVHGEDCKGPPVNPSHVREWSSEEFERLLGWAGLTPVHVGHTRSNSRDARMSTIMAICAHPQLNGSVVDACVLAARKATRPD